MPTEASYPFLQANKYHQGRADNIEVIVVHCTAGMENANGLGAEAIQKMFAHNTRDASAHVTVDQNSKCRSVHDWDTAWHCVHFNANGLGVEIVGMPDQTRAQWLDPISKASLQKAAQVVADWCKRYGIPRRYLSIAELRAGNVKGITFHADCDKARPSSGHTDPGPNFPRDAFLQMVIDEYNKLSAPPAKKTNPFATYWAPCRYGDGMPPRSPLNKVKAFQWAMGIPVDGMFGHQSEASVNALKHKWGHKQDGLVDTWVISKLRGITR